MTNIERAAAILKTLHREDQLEGDGVVGCFDATAAAQALADAGFLTPDPQIIRTHKELEALDPETLVLDALGNFEQVLHLGCNFPLDAHVPAVVVAAGPHARTAIESLGGEIARTALQEATE